MAGTRFHIIPISTRSANIPLDLACLLAQYTYTTFLPRRLASPSRVSLLPYAIDSPVSAARTPAVHAYFSQHAHAPCFLNLSSTHTRVSQIFRNLPILILEDTLIQRDVRRY